MVTVALRAGEDGAGPEALSTEYGAEGAQETRGREKEPKRRVAVHFCR